MTSHRLLFLAPAWLCALSLLAALPGCGLLSGDDISDSGGTGGETATKLCEDGRLRLGKETCADEQRIVERCHAEVWSPTQECRAPDGCEEGAVHETDEVCGEEKFNRHLLRCSGELLQPAGCTCGAVEPSGVGWYPLGIIARQEQADELAGQSYVWWIEAGGTTAEPGVVIPRSVRCATHFYIGANNPPDVSHIVAGGDVALGGKIPPLPALRRANYLAVGNTTSLGSLSNLEEIATHFVLRAPELETLDGLESLRVLGSLAIEAEKLRSLEALSQITSLSGMLHIRSEAPSFSLQGLHNIRTIGEGMLVPIANESELHVFDALREVGGNVGIILPPLRSPELVCAVGAFFAQKTIGGELRLAGYPYDPEKCADL